METAIIKIEPNKGRTKFYVKVGQTAIAWARTSYVAEVKADIATAALAAVGVVAIRTIYEAPISVAQKELNRLGIRVEDPTRERN